MEIFAGVLAQTHTYRGHDLSALLRGGIFNRTYGIHKSLPGTLVYI